MPSKAAIELSQHFTPHVSRGAARPSGEVPALLERVRDLRDTFVDWCSRTVPTTWSSRLLGAAMAGPRVEHLAHLVAWSVQQGHTVQQMQRMPFYHPVIEEALQDALKDTAQRVLAAGMPEIEAA